MTGGGGGSHGRVSRSRRVGLAGLVVEVGELELVVPR